VPRDQAYFNFTLLSLLVILTSHQLRVGQVAEQRYLTVYVNGKYQRILVF
jgi:hypothetical protein